MQPWSRPLQGRFEEHVVVSEALRGNPLGDPHERPLWIYLPPGYADEPHRRYPTLYQIQGLTGQLDMWRNRAAFRPTVPELLDELFSPEATPHPASSSGSTPGPPSAAASSSTRPAPAATTPLL